MKFNRSSIIIASLVLVGELVVYGFSARPNSEAKLTTPQYTPSTLAQSLNQGEIDVKESNGKVMIVDYWATWCPPCVAEIPHFNSLYKKYASKGLEIVGVSLDQGSQPVKSFIQNKGIQYPIVMGTADLRNAYGEVKVIPTTFIVNRNNEVVHKIEGYHTEAQLEALITPLL